MGITKTKHKIEAAWFRQQFERNGLSMREFAKRVKLDIASLSRTLAGTRKFVVEDADRWASVLGVPVEDVLAHVGVKRLSLAKARTEVVPALPLPPLAGVIDAATGVVTFHPTFESAGADLVAMAVVGDPFLTGWHVLCRPTDVQATGEGIELGIVRLANGQMVLRKIRPSFLSGRYDLGPVFGFGDRDNDVEIVGVIPVTAMRRREGG